jgi:Leucine-rich repeat (LRR) protein
MKLCKDTLFLISIKLDFKSFINFAMSYKSVYTKIINNENIWRYFLQENFSSLQLNFSNYKSFSDLSSKEKCITIYSLLIFQKKMNLEINVYDLYERELLILNGRKEIPKQISCLYNLKRLYMDDGEIKQLPYQLFELKNLEILSLENNCIEEIPENLKQLKNLKIIRFICNPLRKYPKFINKKNFPQLETVEL